MARRVERSPLSTRMHNLADKMRNPKDADEMRAQAVALDAAMATGHPREIVRQWTLSRKLWKRHTGEDYL